LRIAKVNTKTPTTFFSTSPTSASAPSKDWTLRLSWAPTRRNTDWLPSGDNGDGFLLNVSRGFGSNFTGAAGCDTGVTCAQNGRTPGHDERIQGDALHHRPRGRVQARGTDLQPLHAGVRLQRLRDRERPRLRVPPVHQGRHDLPELAPGAPVPGLRRDPLEQLPQRIPDFRLRVGRAALLRRRLHAEHRRVRLLRSRSPDPDFGSAPGRDQRLPAQGHQRRVLRSGDRALNDRLFVTVGGRLDGNSAFGEGFGLQFYPKVSLSYVVSDESFWNWDWWRS
ncbi:MAG: hypothetical protein MZV70_08055, partial [Desulfobacterales bacterium]|nr:hypothetical protein [Desulfobacterales bacterium]